MVSNLILSQSNYPLKTIFKGDSVVILRVQQADEINRVFDKQTKDIITLRLEIEELKKQVHEKDSIVNSFVYMRTERMNIDSTIAQRLDLIEHWLYWSAIEGSWIYYSKEDSLIYRMDLSDYKAVKDDRTGDLFFYYKEQELEEGEEYFQPKPSPELNWQFAVRRSRRPKIEVVPIKQ